MGNECYCKVITPKAFDSIEFCIHAAENDGAISESAENELIEQLEEIGKPCNIVRRIVGKELLDGQMYRRYEWMTTAEIKPPQLYREIWGKKHKLVGVEQSEKTAEVWAANMKEHSGEKVTVVPTEAGFALYREE